MPTAWPSAAKARQEAAFRVVTAEECTSAMAAGATGRLSGCARSMVIAAKWPLEFGERKRIIRGIDRRTKFMRLALIVLGLLATTGVVYAACIFC